MSDLYTSKVLREAVRGGIIPQLETWLMSKAFSGMSFGKSDISHKLYFVKARNNHKIFSEVIEALRLDKSEQLVQIQDDEI